MTQGELTALLKEAFEAGCDYWSAVCWDGGGATFEEWIAGRFGDE